MNKFLSAALFVNVFLSPFLVVASDKDATAVYKASSDVIDGGLGTTSFLSDDSAKSATTRMLHSLKGTKDFIPLHDRRQTSQKVTNFLSNNRQEPHVERNMSTQKFPTNGELQTAVDEYCSNPSEWVNNPKYAMYGKITYWDVSLITDMSNLFNRKSTCNPDIARWDVSAVTNFYSMFLQATKFNQDIGSWDVSKGVNFHGMFYKASAFNQDIGSWDVSNGVYFNGVFRSAIAFNQDIGRWNVSKGVNFNYMFYKASVFRQNLCSWDKSCTSTNNNFCAGSYCGGECSPTCEPSYAPSKISIDLPSSIPTVNPSSVPSSAPSKTSSDVPSSIPTVNPSSVPSSAPSKTCNVVDVFAQTLFLPGAGACWRVQLAFGGTLEGDFTDASCSKTESKWQSTNGVFSIFASISVLDETAVFIPGTNGFSGTFQFVEDPTVTQASLQMLSWDPTAKVFATEVTIPTCSADAVCPTMKIKL